MVKAGVKPNIISYSTLISAWSKQACSEKSVYWFDRLTADGLRPDVLTWKFVLRSFGNAGDAQGAETWLAKMRASSISIDAECLGVTSDAARRTKRQWQHGEPARAGVPSGNHSEPRHSFESTSATENEAAHW